MPHQFQAAFKTIFVKNQGNHSNQSELLVKIKLALIMHVVRVGLPKSSNLNTKLSHSEIEKCNMEIGKNYLCCRFCDFLVLLPLRP